MVSAAAAADVEGARSAAVASRLRFLGGWKKASLRQRPHMMTGRDGKVIGCGKEATKSRGKARAAKMSLFTLPDALLSGGQKLSMASLAGKPALAMNVASC